MTVEATARATRIHIDREPYQSPNPTTSGALYHLGQIADRRELFREIGGDAEDLPVPRTNEPVHLSENEHFYSQTEVTILVNGEPEEVTETKVSFEEVVKLAFAMPPLGQCIEFTVTYRDGPSANPKGTLTVGHSVKITNRMKFDVTATDRS